MTLTQDIAHYKARNVPGVALCGSIRTIGDENG